MGNRSNVEWRKLPISLNELCINTTLRCGQSFRWRKSGADQWSCALHGRLITLKQDSTHLHYRSIFPPSSTPARLHKRLKHGLPTPPPSSPASVASVTNGLHNEQIEQQTDGTLDLLKHYLNLKPNLQILYADWSAKDPNFHKRFSADIDNLQGIRMLKQDPWEALCGFICSSNNNIKRISLMMNRLAAHYGRYIGDLEEEVVDLDAESDTENTPPSSADQEGKTDRKPRMKKIKVPYHDFPPPSALTDPDVEATLRQLGFGYRAKYIYQTACVVANEKGGVEWLESLMNPDALADAPYPPAGFESPLPPGGREGYRRAHEELLQLTGVGPKVADCVCLMGLGWGEAMPVDTHVWQIAVRDYHFGGKGGKNATMTKALYDAVGDKFRQLWGIEAGWAQTVLFTADLRDFVKARIMKMEIREEVIDDEGTVIVKKEEVDEDGVVTKEESLVAERPSGRAQRAERKALQVKRDVVVEKMVKRPLDDGERRVVEVHEDMMSRVKRRRSGRP